ncbi:MAG: ATP-binding protein [Chitinophagia bacterium]|nr:ATP-binding protein [Chitinophagia bacterium]
MLSEKLVSTEGTNGEKGFGFGLALVNSLITQLGGTLSVSSKKGAGSSFGVTIPFPAA